MNIDFNYDEILFLEGETGTVGIVKVAHDNKMLFIRPKRSGLGSFENDNVTR